MSVLTVRPAAPAPAAPRPAAAANPRRVLAAAVFGFFLVGLDALVVNVALPAVGRGLGGGLAGLQWVVDAYTLAFAALMLSAGALSDRIGAKRAYGAGVLGFTLSSVACGLAPSLAFLVGARAVQGATASVMLPASLALVRQAFPEPGRRARAITVWTASGSAAAAAGPVAGGVVTSVADWRWIFFLNIPAGIVALALLAGTPRSDRRAAPFDTPGLLTSVLALGGLTYGFIEGGVRGFTAAPVLAAFAVTVAAAAGFAVAEMRQAEPMVPLDLFRHRAISLTAATGFAVNAAFYGAIFALSLYFQQVGHRSPLATGLLFMPVTAVVTVVNLTVAARMVTRIGPRVAMAVGLAGTAAAMLVLLAVRPDLPLPVLAALLLPIAFAGSFAVPALTIMLMGSVPAERAGTAAGVNNTARQVGGALAVAFIGVLVGRPGGFAAGMHAGLVGIAAVLLVTAVAVLALLPRKSG